MLNSTYKSRDGRISGLNRWLCIYVGQRQSSNLRLKQAKLWFSDDVADVPSLASLLLCLIWRQRTACCSCQDRCQPMEANREHFPLTWGQRAGAQHAKHSQHVSRRNLEVGVFLFSIDGVKRITLHASACFHTLLKRTSVVMILEHARDLGLHVGRPFSNNSCRNCVVKFVQWPKVKIKRHGSVGEGAQRVTSASCERSHRTACCE